MQAAFSEDQEQFRLTIGRFLQDKSPPSAVRSLMATEQGFDASVWSQMCGELGLAGMHIPEAYGGFGFGPVELGIVAEEMGRHLYCGPFFASAVMAAGALMLNATSKAKEAWLPGIADGSVLATLVLDSLDGPEQIGAGVSVQAGALHGLAPLVVDAHLADLMVVIARDAQGLNLYTLTADTAGVVVEPIEVLDPTRKLARVIFDGAVVEHAGNMDEAAVAKTWDYMCVALAHEMIGGAQQLLETTLEYTKLRYQFGRPIGSFQSLKHRCADLLLAVETAKAATHHAAQCLAAGEGEPYLPSMVKAMAADTYMLAAKEAIQMRGGIGFTWEEDTHLWFKRAKSSEVFLGLPSVHRERMMTMIEQQESVL